LLWLIGALATMVASSSIFADRAAVLWLIGALATMVASSSIFADRAAVLWLIGALATIVASSPFAANLAATLFTFSFAELVGLSVLDVLECVLSCLFLKDSRIESNFDGLSVPSLTECFKMIFLFNLLQGKQNLSLFKFGT
jgi:hypothetical protein